MEVDVNRVIYEYDKMIMELNRKVILLTVENEQLKKMLEERKEDK